MCMRNEGETFDDYTARRKRERETLDAHLRGVLVVKSGETNRTEMRAIQFRPLGHKSYSNQYYSASAKRRKNRKLLNVNE